MASPESAGDAASPYREMPDGVRVSLRVTPGASVNSVCEVRDGALQVKVTAPPEDGKANAAVIKLLAKHWRIAPSGIDVIAGATNRNKTLLVRGYTIEELGLASD